MTLSLRSDNITKDHKDAEKRTVRSESYGSFVLSSLISYKLRL